MKFSNGAGGVAAAMLLLALGTLNPTPSRAWQMSASTPTPAPAAPAQAAPVVTNAVVTLPVQPAPQSAIQAPSLQSAVQTIATPAPAPSLSKADEDCLATAVYFEAKGEPRRGQLAVAQVIVNRTHSGRFPRNVCGVVKQRGQFSFVHGGRLPSAPHSSAAWREAVSVADKVLDGSAERVASNALFFHARGVSAGWHAVRVAQIGNQVFYR
ncbi:MAG TPA: cell wall hydrolase [Allosphingosinicella sp.]|jgi:spore germination cell wall hydrolase CwlJ-like protein|nr:cell wall hydrolase [Allosphingosinicella sp.]